MRIVQQNYHNKFDIHNTFFISESGAAEIVEATILLPFCMIMVLALYYASIFMCQKANLQANVQNALIYYKNVDSDTFVEASGNMSYGGNSGTVGATGSRYGSPAYKFPYRFFFMNFEKSKFESFFRSMCGHMFFDDGSNVELTVESKNYVVYKTITAKATQTVKPMISLKMVGVPDSMTISVTGKVVITNGDDMIRNTDFVIDVVKQTAIGEKATELLDKVSGYYNSFKEKFGVNERS
ncbi:MAG: hypothetical protein HDQ96_14690 [Lachnospiraceae bacterium]|nr:hypothetical protein [Lachnospiraceae bacterium]